MTSSNANLASASRPCRHPTRDLLSVRNLSVRYRVEGQDFAAVDRVSFNISPGEIVGLLGESGCGKTTTALSLLGLTPAAARVSGSVSLCGRDIFSLRESERRRIRGAEIAIIYRDSSVLNPVMRAGDQVSEVLRAHQICSAQCARQKVMELFAAIGLGDPNRIYDAYPHQLSGGQRQRIAVAQGLICDPRLVIADEAVASVDPDTAIQILGYFKQLAGSSDTSFLFITHDPAILASFADRVMVMYAGQIVESGPLRDVYSRPQHPYTRALLQCSPELLESRGCRTARSRMPFIPGYAPDPLDPPVGCSFASRCSDFMNICDSVAPANIDISDSWSARCFKCEVH
jgi:oligopeptide/dipeptide ABC transporter ATP-binding protein